MGQSPSERNEVRVNLLRSPSGRYHKGPRLIVLIRNWLCGNEGSDEAFAVRARLRPGSREIAPRTEVARVVDGGPADESRWGLRISRACAGFCDRASLRAVLCSESVSLGRRS